MTARASRGAAGRRFGSIGFGADYNPEQWPEATWDDDVALMRSAGVNLVTVGVFSWARLEPREGERDFGWLDRALDLLHGAAIGVDLATPVASPPAWLARRYPGTLPVGPDGTVLHQGSRNHFCPSSPDYRRAANAITSDLVSRYAQHPAVQMWHVGNEYGQACWCDTTAEAFRAWLRSRHGDLTGLNRAWGTTFWSQAYAEWDEIVPPRSAPYLINPGEDLDFRRFCSDALRELFREQKQIIRQADPEACVTTNVMGFFPGVDSWSWCNDVDVVANDVYRDPSDPLGHVEVALSHDLTRGLGSHGAGTARPWILMEHATSAVNWRSHNTAKLPGDIERDALQAVARGAEAVCYFQWRQSRFGAEMAHSAMLPNAGPDTRIHQEVRALGAELASLSRHAPSLVSGPAPSATAGVDASVALLFDWAAWWASGHPSLPTDRLDSLAQLRRWYAPLHEATVTADVIGPDTPLGGYRLVLVPQAYLLEQGLAQRLQSYVEHGGHLVVGPFSGIVDGAGHLGEGRFPSAVRELLGVSGEEWRPLTEPQVCVVDRPALVRLGLQAFPTSEPDQEATFLADIWAEHLRCDGAIALARHRGGDAVLDGQPAITRNAFGAGVAWYVSVVPERRAMTALTRIWTSEAGADPVLDDPPPGVEAIRRGELTFLLNHGPTTVTIRLPGAAPLTDVLTGEEHTGDLALAAHASAVLVHEQMETRP